MDYNEWEPRKVPFQGYFPDTEIGRGRPLSWPRRMLKLEIVLMIARVAPVFVAADKLAELQGSVLDVSEE